MATENELLQAIAEIDNVETLRDIFAAIAAALRRKGVDKDPMYPEEFASLIDTVETGTDTDDADAVAEDIVRNKTAYVKGQKITGNAQEVTANNTYNMNRGEVSEVGGIRFTSPGMLADMHFRPDSKFSITVTDYATFGDARASDVVSGKTFTSSAGLKKTGTASLGTNTSDATATASDIATGKIAYGASGKITGNLPVQAGITQSLTPQVSTNYFDFYYTVPNDMIIRSGQQINLYCSSSDIGDAAASDVAKGKTFTSKNGLKLTGTATLGVDTSNATATASDIASGKTAYVSSGKVTGNVSETASGFIYTAGTATNLSVSGYTLYVEKTIDTAKIIRSGGIIRTFVGLSDLGNATASDVASGKTFTSTSGLKISGNITEIANGSTYSLSSATPSISGSYFYLKKDMAVDRILRTGSTVSAYCTKTQLGDATAADVASGKTFTSSAGLALTGTASIEVYTSTVANGVQSSRSLNVALPNNYDTYSTLILSYLDSGAYYNTAFLPNTAWFLVSAYIDISGTDPLNSYRGIFYIRDTTKVSSVSYSLNMSYNGKIVTIQTPYDNLYFVTGIYKLIAW